MNNDQVTTLLDRIEQQLTNDDVAGATDTALELQEEYEALAPKETIQFTRASTVRTDESIPQEDRELLDQYTQQHSSLELARGALLGNLTMYLSAPDNFDSGMVTEKISSVRDSETTVAETATNAEQALTDVTVPAAVAARVNEGTQNPVPKGTAFTATATVVNTGNKSASDVTISTDSPDGVTVTINPTSTDTLGAGESFIVTVDGTADSEGEHVIPVLVNSADAGEERLEIDLRVVNKSRLITDVSELLGNLRTKIENLDLGRGRQQALLSSISAAYDSVDRSQQQLKKGNTTASNNSLTTAQNQLGAFLNKLDAGSGGNSKGNNGKGGGGNNSGNGGPSGPLSETKRVTLERSAENAIDLLAAAKEAAK